MEIHISVWLFILWIIFWSFGSVLLLRLSKNINFSILRSLFIGRSQCPHCQKKLGAKELVPIVSFFLQKKKCISCKNPISWMYPWLELLSWLVFVCTYLFIPYESTGELIYRIVINWTLLLLFIYDLFTYELHVVMRAFALITALLPQFFGLGDRKIAVFWLLFFWWVFLLLYAASTYYVRNVRKQVWEWMWEWDIFLAWLLWVLLPYIFSYHNIPISLANIVVIFLLFIVISSSIWIVFYFFIKRFPKPSGLHLPSSAMPFIPALILWYWVLLIFWDYFISLFF